MIKVSNGNIKIGNDTLILNMNSATDCPSRELGLCNIDPGKCYALKAEIQYPDCRPYRREQEKIWNSLSGQEIGQELIKVSRRKKKNKINYVRFSESGDFRSQDDVEKMKAVALELARDSEINLYGYTARHDLCFDNLSSNLSINGSGFMISNMFTAVKEIGSTDIICPGNCRFCNMCKQENRLDIKVLYH